MSTIVPTTGLERAAGSLTADVSLTLVAAAAGSPLAALLPVLGKTLAAERQRKRVEATLVAMDELLKAHSRQLEELTDPQYKFVNESILALLHTTNERKMALLKNAVRNGLVESDLPSQEAVFLSRIVRDISHEEVDFLARNFAYHRIWLSETPAGEHEVPTVAVTPQSPDGQIVVGLISLGLVMPAEATWDDSGLLRFSPLVVKLLALLREADA
ncbi:MAG: hypothetical protein ING66_11085 [Rhodocyclaceae bacterium]|jgi:hypothetical protein|nr:hypothetical protein [Rhodocyclaceae bacterium]MCA3022925.1 hypothetical protein [Rhodocyclaceae bacterium]MCA3029128.1 hypothetical protein [Rhodocyclaceae bacterium]MCA3055419.1 hypothetical protein [Rhodocyclaceae bacterium]MCA3060908.1 hypothetical protein [Rhodocyclaceae bacterium]